MDRKAINPQDVCHWEENDSVWVPVRQKRILEMFASLNDKTCATCDHESNNQGQITDVLVVTTFFSAFS